MAVTHAGQLHLLVLGRKTTKTGFLVEVLSFYDLFDRLLLVSNRSESTARRPKRNATTRETSDDVKR